MLARSIGFALCTLLALGCASDGDERVSDRDCDRPIPPEVPDGKTASDVAMISATQRMKLYVESANDFLDCLDRAEQSIGATARDIKQKRIGGKRDEARADLEQTTANFNEQVRVYKARRGETSEDSD